MDTNAVLSLCRPLAQAVLDKDEKRAAILAADLLAAWAQPQSYSPCPNFKPGAAT